MRLSLFWLALSDFEIVLHTLTFFSGMNLRLIPFLLLLPIIACKKRLVAEILESIKYTTFEISDASEIASIFESELLLIFSFRAFWWSNI